MNLSGERGTSAISRFVQQSLRPQSVPKSLTTDKGYAAPGLLTTKGVNIGRR